MREVDEPQAQFAVTGLKQALPGQFVSDDELDEGLDVHLYAACDALP